MNAVRPSADTSPSSVIARRSASAWFIASRLVVQSTRKVEGKLALVRQDFASNLCRWPGVTGLASAFRPVTAPQHEAR